MSIEGFAKYKTLTIKHANVDADLTDFPVYVEADDDADLKVCRDDGFDIRFTNSDGSTVLKYTRDHWDGGDGDNVTAGWFVKVPLVSTDSNTVLRIYYSKSDATDGQAEADTWNSAFKFRSGMSDKTTSTINDSTSATDGDKKGANEPIEATGKIGKAQHFDGTDDDIALKASSAFIPSADDPFTMSAWVKADTIAAGNY